MTKKEAYWSAHLAAIDATGFTTMEYARREGLSAKTLFYWRGRLRAGRSAASAEASAVVCQGPRFVAVAVRAEAAAAAQPACSVVFGTRVRLDFAALPPPAWVAELVRVSQAGGL